MSGIITRLKHTLFGKPVTKSKPKQRAKQPRVTVTTPDSGIITHRAVSVTHHYGILTLYNKAAGEGDIVAIYSQGQWLHISTGYRAVRPNLKID